PPRPACCLAWTERRGSLGASARIADNSQLLLESTPMITKTMIAALASLLVVGHASLPADAQDQKVPEPKGVNTRGLVTSLGAFSATVNAPLFVSGATVELEPGGQTGRQQFRVPTYIFVIEGQL